MKTIQCTHGHITCRHKAIAIVVMRRVHCIVFMTSLYLHYAPCSLLVEQSVCHETISVLINYVFL